MDLLHLIESKIEKLPDSEGGHWLWTSSLVSCRAVLLKRQGAKRLKIDVQDSLYESNFGKIPEGMRSMSTCSTRCCLAPDHQGLRPRGIRVKTIR